MRGVILAAGMGLRLRPLTSLLAKPAVPFLNRPLIRYSLDVFKRTGIDEIAVNLHHLPDTVKRAVADSGFAVEYSYEETLLGTAGALKNLSSFLDGKTFVVSNGKIFFEEPLQRAIAFHENQRALATLVLVPSRDEGDYNPVVLDPEKNLVGFGWKTLGASDPKSSAGTRASPGRTPYVYTGIQILEPEFLDFIPEGPSDTVKDVFPKILEAGAPVKGFVSLGYWTECSTPRRYLDAHIDYLRRAEGFVGIGSVPKPLDQGLYFVLADNVTVHETAVVEDSVLWKNTAMGKNSRLRHCIVTTGVKVPPDFRAENVILTPKINVEPSNCERVPEEVEGLYVWPLEPDG